ncbi:MAG: sialidase family protein [Opitutaceae bacterium]
MKSRPLPLLALFVVGFGLTALAQPPAKPTRIPGAAQPQLAVASDGRVWLAYGKGTEVFVARSDDSGATFGAPSSIATLPKLALGMRRGPRIAAKGDEVTVTLIADELVAYHSSDGGKSWRDAKTINEVPTSAREGLHDLAASPDGRLFLTWLDLRNGKTELWGAESLDAGKTWGKNQQVYRSPDVSICECCHPTALFDGEGNLAIMWRNSIGGSRDMWMATRARGAGEFAPAKKLGEGTWNLNACPMDGGKIVALGGGNFGAVWQRAGEVFYVPAKGPEVLIGKGKQPVAITQGAESLVLWQQDADLMSMRGIGKGEPAKRATDARYAVVVSLPGNRGTLLAYEQGPAKEKQPGIVVERL